jgi:TolB-like protein/Flp pilus assembly protein TadD
LNGRPRRTQKHPPFHRYGNPVTDTGKAVFLSYASQDAEAARQLCNALRAAGIEVWFDQSELRGGDAWDASIRRQIKACALFVPIISRHTHTRDEGYFRLEWKLAVDRSHLMVADRPFLLPVVIDDTSDQDEKVPDRFRDVQWTRLPGGKNAEALVERVRRLLTADTTMPAATDASSSPQPAAPTVAASRSWVPWIVGGLLVLATGYILIDKFIVSKHTVATTAAPATAATPAVSDKSIAVLPFTDLSEKHDEEYFSDGLSEDLIDLLTKVPELHVPARASSFYFKGQHVTIAEIAKALSVAYVLEGTVRKAGATIRVRTELIRADNGYNVWSETYDRDLKDIFKVQDEIAGRVLIALKAALPAAKISDADRTDNTEAYNQYLLGRNFQDQWSLAGFQRGVDAFKKAIALDQNYAAAYAGLAEAEAQVADKVGDLAGITRALADANRTIELAPHAEDGYRVRGFLRTIFLWDWDGAQKDLNQALSLDPNGRALGDAADLASAQGRLTDAIALQQRANQSNPLLPAGWSSLGYELLTAGRIPEARAALARALEINPNFSIAHLYVAWLELHEGRPDQALAATQQIQDRDWQLQATAIVQYSLHHPQESQQALDELIKTQAADMAYQIAEVYAWRGEKDRAFAWLDRAVAQRDGGLIGLKLDEILASLRTDPRYQTLLRKMNLPQ